MANWDWEGGVDGAVIWNQKLLPPTPNLPATSRRLDSIFHRQGTDYVREGTVHAKDCWANLKYYTWVEQQGMSVEDLNAQWYDTKNTWDAVHAQAKELDELINEFNDEVGLLKAL